MKLFTTSMMCVDMFKLQEQIKIIDAYTDMYHMDVMDGHYVPNLALSYDFIKQLRDLTSKPIDAHLMITNPAQYIDLLTEIKVDYISLHADTILGCEEEIIKKLIDNNIKLGIVLKPKEGLETLDKFNEVVEKVTVMTVEPGFAGQGVIKSAIDKIKLVYDYRNQNNLNFLIEVDGSNNYTTFEDYNRNGTDIFVLGSTLFKNKDLAESYKNIIDHIEALQ